MKSIGTRFYLFTGIVIFLFSILLLYRTYSISHLLVDQLVEQQVDLASKFDLAIRDYITEKVRPILSRYAKEDEFLPEVMSSSFVARSIFDEVQKYFPGAVLKFASNNPRNPANRATPEEIQLIAYFNRNPEVKQWKGEVNIGGQKYFAYFHAHRMKESCLYCHGDPSDAPKALIEKYGDVGGFHRQVGKVVALDTVAIPLAGPMLQLRKQLLHNGIMVGFGLSLVLIALFCLLRFFITNRLSGMTSYFVRIARKDEYMDIMPLPVKGNDEITILTRSFNVLAQKLRRYHLNQDKQLEELMLMNEEMQDQIAERKKAEEAKLSSEENYRTLFEDSRDAIHITSKEGKFIDFNQAALDLFGYTRQEMKDLDISEIYVDPEEHMIFQETIEKDGSVRDYPMVLKRKDGRVITCLLTSSTRQDKQGNIIGYHGIMRDITERRQLEEQLQQSQKMETLGRLAGGVAHDFNNILTSIMGYAELGIRSLEKDDPALEYLKIMREAGGQAANLTRRLLAFSRKQVLEMRVLCLSAVVLNMGKMLGRIIGEDIKLEFHAQAARNILADNSQIEQILMNLAVNARDAMLSGGRLIIETIDVSVDESFEKKHREMAYGDYVLLSVTDTGEGIDPEFLDHIFEPFFTTKLEGRGTGLGLSMVYGIVRQHNGHILVTSEKGRGTTFLIYFPASEDESSKNLQEEEKEMQRGTETLLVVEDENAIRQLIFQVLEPLGYNIVGAANGEEALALLQSYKGKIDMLLTDVIMPGMNGRELADRVQPLMPGIKIVFMSGYTDDLLKSQGIEKSFELLSKPLTPMELAMAIRKVLDKP